MELTGDQTICFHCEPCYFNGFQFAPRPFTITTNNTSAKFNTLMLFATSKVISKLFTEDPKIDQYHIDIQDETNIIGKLEQLYQGEKIEIKSGEAELLEKFRKKLDMMDFFHHEHPNWHYFPNNNNISFFKFKDSCLQIDQRLFLMNVDKHYLESFTIQTKKNEYKCNIYGVFASKVIHNFLNDHSKADRYVYDYEDEEDEFQYICSIFNFETVKLTKDNAEIIKEIAHDLQIECIFNQIENFITESEKVSKSIDDQQNIIDTIDDLFNFLYNIKVTPIDSVVKTIKKSRWSKSDENIFELASFILQVVKHSIEIHKYLIDLLIELDKLNEMKILLPFVVDRSIQLFFSKTEKFGCNLIFPFVYQLSKRGIISKDKLTKILKRCNLKNSFFVSWFFPELIEIYSNMNTFNFQENKKENQKENNEFNPFDFEFNQSVIKLFYPCDPNKIEIYKIMRDNGEDDNEITKAIRNDDIDEFQKFITKDGEKSLTKKIKPNMFEPFDNKEIRYLNYAAAHGSIKCFKYILLNNEKIDDITFEMAIVGGNIELIRIVNNEKIENISILNKRRYFSNRDPIISNALHQSIKNHKNDLFDWIIEQNLSKINEVHSLLDLVYCSIKNGNPHALVQLIDNGFHFHNCQFRYPEFLSIAAKNGFYLFLTFLFNLISNNKNKLTLEILPESTISFGNIYIFKLFEDKMNESEIESALFYAIKYGYFDIIKYIFSNNQFNFDSTKSLKILKHCFENYSKEILDFMLDKVKDYLSEFTIKTFYELLEISYKSCNFEATKFIIEFMYKNNSNNDFTEAFLQAANYCLTDVIEFFINSKCLINYADLIEKIEYFRSNEEIFSLILKKIDPELKERMINSIDLAIEEKNKHLVKFLLNENAPLENALITAVKANEFELVEMVLNKNSDPSYIDKYSCGETALTIAVKKNNLQIVKKILSIPGINPNVHDKNFLTPFMLSICIINLDIFNLFIDFYGDEINKQKNEIRRMIKIIIDSCFCEKIIGISSSFESSNYNDLPLRFNSIKSPSNIGIILQKFIELNCIDPNLSFQNGTLLTLCCKLNLVNLVSSLLKDENIDVNLSIPETGDTPLITSIKNKSNKITKLLLDHPKININQKNFFGFSPLIYALSLNDENLVDLLIKNEKFDQKESDINLAFYLSNSKMSKKLISFESLDINYVPYQASDYDHSITVKNNNDSNVDVYLINKQIENKSPLMKSIYDFDYNLFESLIQHPSFHKDKNKIIIAIRASIKSNTIEILNKLFEISKEFDIDINTPLYDKVTPLLEAIYQNSNTKMLSFILNHSDFNLEKNDINEALILVCSKRASLNMRNSFFSENRIEIVNLLYDFDCNHNHIINDKINEEGSTYLKTMYSTIISSHYIDPNMPDEKGNYPLLFAIQNDSYIISLCLLNSDEIDINKKLKINNNFQQFNQYKTYLHTAAYLGRSKILEAILTKSSCDVNIKNNLDETPLMEACRNGHIECVKILFKNDKLDFLHRNNIGKDALDLVRTDKNSGENKKITDKDEYLSELLKLMKSNNQKKEEKENKKTNTFQQNNQQQQQQQNPGIGHINTNKFDLLSLDKFNFSFSKPKKTDPSYFEIEKIDTNKMKEAMKKSLDSSKQKSNNDNSSKLNKENADKTKSPEIPEKFLHFQPLKFNNDNSDTKKILIKKKFDTYNESFSEKPDEELQNLLDNLRKKSQTKIEDAENESKLKNRPIQKKRKNMNAFDDNEIDLYQSYRQQFVDQNQLLLMQKQQQQWLQMIQINDGLQAQINMQMMSQSQLMNKKLQNLKKKKKSFK